MIAKRGAAWLGSLAAVAFASLALASGLDRYCEYMPSAVRLVPEAMRVTAKRSEAALALTRGDYADAAALAAVAVDRDPMDVRGAAFLGAALQLSGERRMARRVFVRAAALGWREPVVQAYWFAREWGRGGTNSAAIRLDALLRAHPEFAPAQGFLSAMEANPAARRALIARLRGQTHWATSYLAAFDATDETLRERARFISMEGARGLTLGCGPTRPMARELLARNYRAEADALLASQCPSEAVGGALADSEFDRFGDDGASGFGWQRHGSGDTRITPVGRDDRGLELANRSGVTRMVLSQPVALDAGEYFVRGAIPGAGADRLLVSFDCGTATRPAQRKGTLDTGLVLTARNCPNQIFSLWVRPGDGAVTINAITIEPGQKASPSRAP